MWLKRNSCHWALGYFFVCTEQQALSAGTARGWVAWMCRRGRGGFGGGSFGQRIFCGRGQEGASLHLQPWLFLWMKLWSYPERGGGKKKEITCGFLTPWPHKQVGVFCCCCCFLNQTNCPQQNMKNFSTNPLYSKKFLPCCFAFLGLRLMVPARESSVWVWEFGGINYRRIGTGICTQGTRNLIQALSVTARVIHRGWEGWLLSNKTFRSTVIFLFTPKKMLFSLSHPRQKHHFTP